MKNRWPILSGIMIVAVLVSGFIIWNVSSNSTTGSQNTTIGIATWPGFAPSVLAKERGYFGSVAVSVDVVDDFTARRAAFESGRHDFTIYTIDSFAFDTGKGLDGQVVMVLDLSNGADGIVSKPEIETVAQLKGKSVAYTRGSPAHFLLVEVLRQGNLSIGDIRTVEVDDPTRAAEAFIAGRVDAAVTWEPYLTQISKGGQGRILASTKTRPNRIVDVLVASRRVIREEPAKVRAVVKGWTRALDEVRSPRADTYAVMAQGIGMPEKEFRDATSGITFADAGTSRYWLARSGQSASPADKLFISASTIWRTEALSQSPTSPENYISDDFLAGE